MKEIYYTEDAHDQGEKLIAAENPRFGLLLTVGPEGDTQSIYLNRETAQELATVLSTWASKS